jgi:hypothetical protein
MKYLKIGIGIFIIWALVVGFAYDTQKKTKKSIEGRMAAIEGFVNSQSGIVTDTSDNLIYCNASQIGQTINGGKCMKMNYIDNNGKIQYNMIAPIYPNYFIDPSSRLLQPVPYGFMANSNQDGIIPTTHSAAYDISSNPTGIIDTTGLQNTYVNYTNNLDSVVQYHDDYASGKYAPDGGGLPSGQMWVKDEMGNLKQVSIFDSSFNNPLYYEPGSYKYGPGNYIPNYENSVYLSNLSNSKTPVMLPPVVSDDIGAGFCQLSQSNIDHICNRLDSNTCSSMSCCNVLDGGKCVGGDKNGPFYPNTINDIINRDFYYYQGKCYGSCNR